MMESLLVANNFDCHILIGFVIQRTYDLSKATLANHLQDLVTVANVVVNDLRGRREREKRGKIRTDVLHDNALIIYFIIASIFIVVAAI